MSFFAGVRIPLFAFPLWIRIIGIVFPLTTSLIVLRGVLLEGAPLLHCGLSCSSWLEYRWRCLPLPHGFLSEERKTHVEVAV
jgi:hypothetical protein